MRDKERCSEKVDAMLAVLPKDSQLVLELVYRCEKSCKEIAAFLGTSPNVIEQQLSDALKQYKKNQTLIAINEKTLRGFLLLLPWM